MGWVLMSERDVRRITVLTEVLSGRLTIASAAVVQTPEHGLHVAKRLKLHAATERAPEAQYSALIDLINRLLQAHPEIDKWNIIGHSDIGTSADGRLGRKSGDPGLTFEWPRLQRLGLGMLPTAGPPAPGIYAGFFQAFDQGSFRTGDSDAKHHFGSVTHKNIKGTPILELQNDLIEIGYFLDNPNGVYDTKTEHVVLAFQEHFVADLDGKRPTGRVDLRTAALIKSVAAAAP